MATRIEFAEKLPQQIFVVAYERPYRGGGTYECCDAYKTRKIFEERVKFLRNDGGLATNIRTYVYQPVPMEVS